MAMYAERVQARINYHLLNSAELRPLQIGTSFGFARWQKGMSAKELYVNADQQPYRYAARQRTGRLSQTLAP